MKQSEFILPKPGSIFKINDTINNDGLYIFIEEILEKEKLLHDDMCIRVYCIVNEINKKKSNYSRFLSKENQILIFSKAWFSRGLWKTVIE